MISTVTCSLFDRIFDTIRESINPITIAMIGNRTAGGRLLSRSSFQGDSRSMFHEAPHARTRERAGHVQALTSRGRQAAVLNHRYLGDSL